IALAKSQEQGLKAVLERLRKGQFIEADAASQTQYRPQMDAVSKALDDVIRIEVDLADAEYRSAVTLVREQALATIAVTLVALALCLAITGLITRSLRRLLGAGERDLVAAAREVAEGRLDHRIAVPEGGAASVAASLNAMSRQFSHLVSGVASSAQWV